MADEEKAPKKVARKRVVKKGVRGSRTPRKKTIAKPNEEVAEASEDSSVNHVSEESETAPAPEASEPVEAPVQIQVVEELPESSEQGNAKKGNSRKDDSKGSNQGDQAKSDSEEGKSSPPEGEQGENRPRRGRNRRGGNSRDREDGQKRPPIDKNEAAIKAWEIYQGELEEEGVSLVDPRRARDVARRCLDLATIFCEERDRYLER